MLSCHLYDQLEIAAMRQQKVRLMFQSPEGEKSIYEGSIRNLLTRQGEEFLLTDQDAEMNLDWLKQIEILA